MIGWASGLRMGVGRLCRLVEGVGVLQMPDAGWDTMRPVRPACVVQLGAGVLRRHVPGVAVGVIIDRHSVVDGVEVMG
jgi:hypothetical protein